MDNSEEASDNLGAPVILFDYACSLRNQSEASIIDMMQVLLALLSSNDAAAALLEAGCPHVEAQGIVKQAPHLMRLALCVA